MIDDHTVRFKTDGPYPLFAERLTALVMQSEKVIREKGDDWMQEHPIGTGPYKLRQVGPQAGAPAGPQRRLLGAEAGLQVRPDPDHPGSGHPDRRADLRRRGHHQGGPPGPDGRDQQVGTGAHRHLADPAHRHAAARPGRAQWPQSLHRRAGAAGREPLRRHGWDHQARAERARGPGSHRGQPDGLRLGPDVKPYKHDIPGEEAPGERRPPQRLRHRLERRASVVEPGLQQTDESMRPTSRKWGSGSSSTWWTPAPPTERVARAGTLGPMFETSWGSYSVFDADGILYDVFKCGETLQLLLQQGARRPDHPGRSTLDAEEADRDLRQGPEAALRRRGLPLQVGPARRAGASRTGSTTRRPPTRSTGCSS